MNPQFYLFVAAVIVVTTAVLKVLRWTSKPLDWELYVAFIRTDFPPLQRDIAQEIAARIAPIVGFRIRELRPEHTLKQVFEWSQDAVSAVELAIAYGEEFGVRTDPGTTFREFVERVGAQPQRGT